VCQVQQPCQWVFTVRQPHVDKQVECNENVEVFAQAHQQTERKDEADERPGLRNLPEMIEREQKGVHSPVCAAEKAALLHQVATEVKLLAEKVSDKQEQQRERWKRVQPAGVAPEDGVGSELGHLSTLSRERH
jgi:hypothetical protein